MNLAMTWRLFRIQLTVTLRNFAGRVASDRGGWRSYLLIGLIGLGFLPLLGSIGGAAIGVYAAMRAAGEPAAALTTFMVTGMGVALIFGFFYVLSAFYFARDLKLLLPLPLTPSTIIGAKFLQVMLSEYLTMAAVVLPVMVVYGIGSGTLLYWPLALIVFLLLPVFPLTIDGLVALLLMNLTTGKRLRFSRDALRVIGALVAIVIAFGWQFVVRNAMTGNRGVPGQVHTGRSLSPNVLQTLALQNQGLIRSVGRYMPPAIWATEGLSAPLTVRGAAGLGSFLLVSLGLLAALLALINRLYLRTILVDEGGPARRAISAAEVRSSSATARPPFAALLWREYVLLVRTPLFLLNAAVALIVPLFMMVPIVAVGQGAGRLRESILRTPFVLHLLPVIGAAIALFVAISGAVTVTSISREGRRFWISRLLPLDPGLQVAAKITLGTLHSLVGALLIDLLMVGWLRLPPGTGLLTLLLTAAASLLAQSGLMIIDLVRPSLSWTDPQQAMKGNLNGVLGMLLGLVLIAVLGGLAVLLLRLSPAAVVPGLIVICLAGAYGLYQWDVVLARTRYREIEE